MAARLIFLAVLFHPKLSGNLKAERSLIVWNVGQGQWLSLITAFECLHFDMGGEFNPIYHVRTLCSRKKNLAYFSHWDWDHISFVRSAQKKLRNLCLAGPPGGRASKKKESLLAGLAPCTSKHVKIQVLNPSAPKGSNQSSRVYYLVGDEILIPGDSPQKQERLWIKQIKGKVKVLALGHHGSNTSTGNHLLNRFNNINQAVASARKARYQHPHPRLLERLRQSKVPILRTEEWGHIQFQL